MTKAKIGTRVITKHTEVVMVEAFRTFPVWSWNKGEQLIRFNTGTRQFEVSSVFGVDEGGEDKYDAWEPLEWNDWLGGKDLGQTKREVTETLENLLALIKATK